MGEASFSEPERVGGGDRNIDDAAAKERPSAGDYDDHGEAIVEIDHTHLRSDRQTAMRRYQSAARRTIVGCQSLLGGRGRSRIWENRARKNEFSHPANLSVAQGFVVGGCAKKKANEIQR